LRERREDIPDLVGHFLTAMASEGLESKNLTPAAMAVLQRYSWPGNVRELENLIRRLTALYAQDAIDAADVEAELADAPVAAAHNLDGDRAESLSETVERQLRRYFDSHGDALPAQGLYDRVLREVERPLISLTLAATNGNQVKAADLLGLNRNTLRKKIRELDIPVVRGINS
jgi:two-component system nitrogen regulation response regulator GlnG